MTGFRGEAKGLPFPNIVVPSRHDHRALHGQRFQGCLSPSRLCGEALHTGKGFNGYLIGAGNQPPRLDVQVWLLADEDKVMNHRGVKDRQLQQNRLRTSVRGVFGQNIERS